MHSQDSADRPVSPGHDAGLSPRQLGSMHPRPPSLVSSRMSDVGSDGERGARSHGQTNTANTARTASRAGTPQTLASPRAARFSQAGRHDNTAGSHPNRGSVASTTASGRAPVLTAKSHVPALTSGAFFRPMSSQKLQAQRASGPRPVPVNQQLQLAQTDIEDDQTDMAGSVIDGASGENVKGTLRLNRGPGGPSGSMRPLADHDTFGRRTANASPSTGHRQNSSMSDSIRPLQKNPDQNRDLHIKVDTSHRGIGGLPSPNKSTRSFRSSFLLPGKPEHGQSSRNRSTNGAEKLSSTASSPRFARLDSQPGPRPSRAAHPKGTGMGKVYQYFQGNTVFCLGGRWQNTKHTPLNIATGLFVLIPCALFYGFEAPWLWQNISPAVPITFAYLTYICLSSFVHASVTDPGILPRHLHQFPQPADDHDPLLVGPRTNDWTFVKSADPTAAAMGVPVKHCRTCDIWRPPRAHHCRLCDNCVHGYDHHCLWLNNCVGQRNYRYFFTFVTSATILCVYLVGISLAQILVYMRRQEISFGESVNHFRVPFVLVILGLVALVYPAGLTGYHLFLMARGQTTREFIISKKFVKDERFRAFSQGNWLKNMISVLCRPRAPTYYRFKSNYKSGDQRLSIHLNKEREQNPQGLELDTVPPGTSASFQGPVTLRGQSRGS